MRAITFVNDVSGGLGGLADFRLFQGNNQVARIEVAPGGKAMLPTDTKSIVAQAFTAMGEFNLSSNVVHFEETAVTLTAEVLEQVGYYDFQLAVSPGTELNAIVCENTWRSPVVFKIVHTGTPFEAVTIVDASNSARISTASQWNVLAIVDGIATSKVAVTDPDATITVTRDNYGGYTLTVS